MATFVKIEGRDPIPVPDEIRDDDALIIKALSPYYPQVAEAELRRTSNGADTIISITPIGKTKGLGPVVAYLDKVKPYHSQAVEVAQSLEGIELDDDALLTHYPQIDRAIKQAAGDIKFVDELVTKLAITGHDGPSAHVPIGF